MLDELAAEGHDFGLSASALRALHPVESMEAWEQRWIPLVAPHLEPNAERFVLTLERHLHRLKAQRVVYTEIFVSGLLFACGDDLGALVELFREIRRRADAIA